MTTTITRRTELDAARSDRADGDARVVGRDSRNDSQEAPSPWRTDHASTDR